MITRVAFTGKLCSGKDTASDFLIRNYGFKPLGFADPIRNFAKDIYGDSWHEEGRLLMQALAKIAREFDPLILIKRIQKIVISYPDTPYVINDVRFPNEVEMLQKLGFTVFRIEASWPIRLSRHIAREGCPPNPDTLNHITETALDGYPLPALDGDLNKAEFCEAVRKAVVG